MFGQQLCSERAETTLSFIEDSCCYQGHLDPAERKYAPLIKRVLSQISYNRLDRKRPDQIVQRTDLLMTHDQ